MPVKKRKKRQQKKTTKAPSASSALHDIYYNYGEEGALNNNVSTLLSKLRESGYPKTSSRQVEEFLSKQPGYSVHRRIKKLQFPRRSILVAAARVRVDGDLIELGDLASWNSGHRFIFVLIDAFSRFVWAVPLKNKAATSTAAALKTLIDDTGFHSLNLYTDAGKEFIGAPFQSVLKSANIKHRICSSDEFHCPFVERVIRTIKEKLFQAMTTNFTRHWLNLLPLVVATYNKTIHSATRARPVEGRKPENHLKVLQSLTRKRQLQRTKPAKYKFKVGEHVRILRGSGGALGRKGYLPRFTWEIFKIKKLANDRPLDGGKAAIPAYILEDLHGEIIEHALFYENELSRVHSTQLAGPAPVREILEEKGTKVKAWFQGFPKASAEWIDRVNLV